MSQLLNRNPKHRLGAVRDADELKEHAFFKMVDWKALALKQVTPPFEPIVNSDESTNYFDPELTEADIGDIGLVKPDLDEEDPPTSPPVSPVTIRPKQEVGSRYSYGSPLTRSVQAKFQGFTYLGGESVASPLHSTWAKAKQEVTPDDDSEEAVGDEYADMKKPIGMYGNLGHTNW